MSFRFTIKFKTGTLAGQTFSIGPGEYMFFGSAESCAIRISDDPTVSQTHACIFYDPSGVIRFKDMGSQFGTARNGKRITTSIILKPGDRMTLGQTSTFQSSWWNALQATSLTRFSGVHHLKQNTQQKSTFLGTRAGMTASAGALILGALFFVLNGESTKEREKEKEKEAVEGENQDPEPLKTETHHQARDLGIFSGAFSAKLFHTKPKRAAKQLVELTPERQFIWDEIVAISRRFGDPPPSAMDPGFVREVEKYLKRFTKSERHKILLERKELYWPTISEILVSKGLPIELGYIVWVESAFQPDAVSQVGAMGPWQFMPETAKEYGLRVGDGIDERKDLGKSTAAAADYFVGLLRIFGTERYLLAVASYNTGQNRVKRFQIASTVNKEKTSDFWHLRFVLPHETAEYVPKFMAAVIIGRNPERWNLAH